MEQIEETIENEEQAVAESLGYEEIPPMSLPHYTVSLPFREILKEQFPGLGSSKPYWRMLGYLMFGTWRNGKPGEPPMPVVGSRLLAEIAGAGKQWCGRNFVAREFLESFRDQVLPITWSGWDSRARRCRVITQLEWPNPIEAALQHELDGAMAHEPQVYLADGSLVSDYTRRRDYQKSQKSALALVEKANCRPAKELLLYLNGRNSRRFTRILGRLPEAHAEAWLTKDAPRRQQQQRVLRRVAACPQPFLKPTRGSVRIFPMTENLLGLRKDLRLLLTHGWLEADIQCAQLAICAADWRVSQVKDFLRDVKMDPWEHFAASAGVAFSAEAKKAFKKAIYSLVFGMRRGRIWGELAARIGDPAADGFFKNPIIDVLLEARDRRLHQIQSQGGASNCFGTWLTCGNETRKGVTLPGTFTRRSILAQLAQALELHLLQPVVDLALATAKDSHGFSVMLWMHDGFTFVPHNLRDAACWAERLEEAVAVQAARLGMTTSLDVTLRR